MISLGFMSNCGLFGHIWKVRRFERVQEVVVGIFKSWKNEHVIRTKLICKVATPSDRASDWIKSCRFFPHLFLVIFRVFKKDVASHYFVETNETLP